MIYLQLSEYIFAFYRIYRPLLVGNDHDCINFLGFFWLAKSEKFAKKIKISPNMIMTNQKGPVKSIKKQNYIQIVGDISLKHVQEQV